MISNAKKRKFYVHVILRPSYILKFESANKKRKPQNFSCLVEKCKYEIFIFLSQFRLNDSTEKVSRKRILLKA